METIINLNVIKKYFLKKDFALFLLIGGVNTLGGVAYSYLYSKVLQANLAFASGYATSLIIAYIINSNFVFHKKLSFKKLIKFAISYIPNFVIQNLLVIFLYNVMHWNILLVYTLAAIIGMPVTFILLKLFAFKGK